MDKKTILVVEDEASIAEVVSLYLKRAGFNVQIASNGKQAMTILERQMPDFVILDLMIPEVDGLSLTRWLRDRSNVPIIMLTARREEIDRIAGLEMGADDYVVKPFSPQELVLRVGAILRRVKAGREESEDVRQIGPLRIDSTAHRVTVDGREIDLTPTEFKLLLLLVERRGRVQPRNLLLEMVWEAAPDIQTRTVDMHVQRLRAKLGVAGDLIETVRGFGYRIRNVSERS